MSIDYRIEAAFSFATLAFYRTMVGTPCEGTAKREILNNSTTWKIIRSTPFINFWKGIQPNTLKILSRTYVQVFSINTASRLTPTNLDPKTRGAIIGIASSSIEASAQNIWNVLITRFIQGQGWSVIKTEGFSLLFKGLIPTILHRAASGVVFWSTYEKLNQINPNYPALSGTGAGLCQVFLTSPLYITTVLRQSKTPPSENLLALMIKIGKTEGWIKGLFLRGLLPRSVLSVATSGPLMTLLERYKIIHR